MTANERIVILIDMDCFYVQVEQRRDPSIRGKPCAVVQYNKWKGGGIIAVSYEARAKGVTRNMRGDDAKEKCSDITLCMVPTANGKADLTRYRDAGAEVIQVLLQFGGVVERASIDEAYIDLTDVIDERIKNIANFADHLPAINQLEHTFIVGYPKLLETDNGNETKEEKRVAGLSEYMKHAKENLNAVRLLMAAALVEEMRLAIYEQTSFRCSAGISHNKVLSKLVCGINKPNKQTLLSMNEVEHLFKEIKLDKIRNLGGKLGQQVIEKYGFQYIGQLTDVSKEDLVKDFGAKTGHWLYEICRGIDREPIKERHVAQSVGCSKTFRGGEVLNTRTKVKHWISCLVTELIERLIQDKQINNRISKGLTAYIGLQGRKPVSRSCQINEYTVEDVSRSVLLTLEQLNQCKDRNSDSWYPGINLVGISAGKFKDNQGSQSSTSRGKDQSGKRITSVASFMTSPKKETCERNMDAGKSDPKRKKTETIPPAKKKMSLDAFISSSNAPFSQENSFADVEQRKIEGDDVIKGAVNNQINTHKSEQKVNRSTGKASIKSQAASDKAGSFFSKMREIRNHTRKTKIEAAYDKLSKHQDETKLGSGVLLADNDKPNVENTLETSKDSSKIEDISLCPKPSSYLYEQNRYDMDQMDMNVFQSLPLYIQQEIKQYSRTPLLASPSNCTAPAQKRQKVTLPGSQKSISGFLSHIKPSFELSKQSNSGQKKSPKSNSTRKRSKVSYHSDYSQKNYDVPLGFFRARTQASAAIRNAVEMHAIGSQKKRQEASQLPKTNKERDPVKMTSQSTLRSSSNQRNVSPENTLWSSIAMEEPEKMLGEIA